jgi:hypothetical protein
METEYFKKILPNYGTGGHHKCRIQALRSCTPMKGVGERKASALLPFFTIKCKQGGNVSNRIKSKQ